MIETAEKVAQYFQENLLAGIFIGFLAGFLAVQSVMPGKRGGLFLYIIVGALGAFLGQFVLVYLDLLPYINEVENFRLLFDFLAAYAGAFVFASLVHFLRPL